jgi:hypothetical protein
MSNVVNWRRKHNRQPRYCRNRGVCEHALDHLSMLDAGQFIVTTRMRYRSQEALRHSVMRERASSSDSLPA